MTSVFDGMAGVINDVFGGIVRITPPVGASYELQAIFREDPVEVFDDDGRGVLLMSPSLSVRRPDAESIAKGDIVEPATGGRFRIAHGQPNGSPAADGFFIYELEEEAP